MCDLHVARLFWSTFSTYHSFCGRCSADVALCCGQIYTASWNSFVIAFTILCLHKQLHIHVYTLVGQVSEWVFSSQHHFLFIQVPKQWTCPYMYNAGDHHIHCVHVPVPVYTCYSLKMFSSICTWWISPMQASWCPMISTCVYAFSNLVIRETLACV